jgi:hypothetical protein
MAYNSGGYNKVNGGVLGGNFLTGSMDFFTIATLVPCFQTNVDTPINLLYTQQGYSTWQPVTVIDGTGTAQTYTTAAQYQTAFTQQYNLNLLQQIFAQNINPIAISVNYATSSNPSAIALTATQLNVPTDYSYSSNFGADYDSSQTVYYIKFITEKTGYWYVNGSTMDSPNWDSNTTGYQFLDAINSATMAGVNVYDNATPGQVLYNSGDVLTPANGSVTSLSNQTVSLYPNYFVVDPSLANRNTVAYVATLANAGSPNVPNQNALPTP